MHTDSEMTSIFDWDSMHYMTAVSLEMSDEPSIFDWDSMHYMTAVSLEMSDEPEMFYPEEGVLHGFYKN